MSLGNVMIGDGMDRETLRKEMTMMEGGEGCGKPVMWKRDLGSAHWADKAITDRSDTISRLMNYVVEGHFAWTRRSYRLAKQLRCQYSYNARWETFKVNRSWQIALASQCEQTIAQILKR